MDTDDSTGELLFKNTREQDGRHCDPLRHTQPQPTKPQFNIAVPPLSLSKPIAISPRPASPHSPRTPISKSPRRIRPAIRTRKGFRTHSITNGDNLHMFELRDALQDIEKGGSAANQNLLKKVNSSFKAVSPF